MHPTLILLAALALTGCKTLVDVEDYRLHTEPYTVQSHPEQATVIVFWANGSCSDVAVPLYQDGTLIGAVKSCSYARHLVPAGMYAFATALDFLERQNETVRLNIEAGKHYFLRFSSATSFKPHQLELIGNDVATIQLVGLPRTEIVTPLIGLE